LAPRVPPLRPIELVDTLIRHEVEFVVIGGVAAVLQGAPYTTFDLDIVYSRTAENVVHLEAALTELDAVLHDLTERNLRPVRSLLVLPGPKLLRTRYGRLDLLGQLDDETSWEQLVQDAVTLPFHDQQVRVLRLERVIAVKEKLGRDKDRAVIPLLRATLARRPTPR
jgi:predicted nucleotidyltransferase